MKRILVGMGACALAAVMFAGGFAVANADSGKGAESTGGESVGAQSPNARLALLVDGGGTTGSFIIRRARGVASVSNPVVGRFCVQPSVPMTLSRIVPDVGTTYDGTFDWDNFAQWNSSRPICPPGRIEIDTTDASDTAYFNDVQWTLTVS